MIGSSIEEERGFTLIELLVVVIVIGVLAGTAIPTFLNQRQKAWHKAAMADLRNSAVVMEEYFDDKGTYLPVGGVVPGSTAPYSFKASGGSDGNVEITLPVGATTTATRYCIEADHLKLAGAPDYHLDSFVGRPVPGGC